MVASRLPIVLSAVGLAISVLALTMALAFVNRMEGTRGVPCPHRPSQ